MMRVLHLVSYISLRFVTLTLFWTPSATDNTFCPKYRVFDESNPTSNQFLAPSGCRCVDEMSGLHCGFCESDAPCRNENLDHVCRTDVVWSTLDTYKSFKCDLSGVLESLFTGGKAYFNANLTDGTAFMSVFNSVSINHQHAVDCRMTGCEFADGGTGAKCTRTECLCTSQCADFTKGVVERTMFGKAVTVFFTEEASSTHMSVDIEDAPFPIEALCNASACTLDPEVASNESLVLKEKDPVWVPAATFSVVVLGFTATIFLLLTCGVFIPSIFSKKPENDERTKLIDGDKENRKNMKEQETQVLEFQNINKIVTLHSDAAKAYGQKEKQILHSISGRGESGTLTAVMGPSGSGKSSLLNIIAAVGDGQARISGRILLNGKQPGKGYRNQVAYVQQDDSLYNTLTVEECVLYSAMLRLPKSMGTEEKRAFVQETLEELRLVEVANTLTRDVSGGERKRISIGMELAVRPSVLVLDEPTSGLDSFAANRIVDVLSNLASRGRIIILSVHQPSAKSFARFDRILLLGEGRALFDGKPSEVDNWLASNGFIRPDTESVADHMLEVISEKAKLDSLDVLGLRNGDEEDNLKFEDKDSLEIGFTCCISIESKPLLGEIMLLLNRTSKDIFRNRQLFFMQLLVSIALAIFTGAIFNDVSNNIAGFQNRLGAFYFSLSFFAFSSFSSMDIFVLERQIFVREIGSKYYRAFSYFFVKTVMDMIILRVIPVTIFTFIIYWIMGLRSSIKAFVIFWATVVLFNVCAGMTTICISIAMPSVGQANLVAVVWFLVMLLFGGFLMNINSMESWYSWLKYTSIFYYSFETLVTNEMVGLLLSFDAPGYPEVPIYGEVFLSTIGMHESNQRRNLICLCSFALGGASIAYCLLLKSVPVSASQQFKKMEDEEKKKKRGKTELFNLE